MAVDSDGPALFRAQLGLFEEEWREDLVLVGETGDIGQALWDAPPQLVDW